MFPGFEPFDIDVADQRGGGSVRIHGVRGGRGSPVLLLHGFPQSHVMWHRVAPVLASGHTVVAADLRGYGDSGRPPAGDDHGGYSFRAMAADQVAVMAQCGFDRFAVVGHDRGARVSHRMALDHPEAVERLALLDILPTAYVYNHVDRRLATAYYHWFFFIQPFDLPERLIAADPAYYLRRLLGGWGTGLRAHDPTAVAQYERCFADPEARHAMLEDYRAGATIDLEHDAASEAAGRRIVIPTLALWGGAGVVGSGAEDPLEVWRDLAAHPALVRGQALAGAGHFLVEQRTDETLAALAAFLDEDGRGG
jgi:haloacetate dehalogenase